MRPPRRLVSTIDSLIDEPIQPAVQARRLLPNDGAADFAAVSISLHADSSKFREMPLRGHLVVTVNYKNAGQPPALEQWPCRVDDSIEATPAAIRKIDLIAQSSQMISMPIGTTTSS